MPEQASNQDVTHGAPSTPRFVAAAEWVGVLSSHGPREDAVRFAPGGLVHAFDQATRVILCGADVQALELFLLDFASVSTGLHCDDCALKARAWPIDPTVDGKTPDT